MRVLFVYKNSEWIGVEYLMACLEKAGHETALFFEPGGGDVELPLPVLNWLFRARGTRRRLLREVESSFQPDLIAFSCLSNLFPWVREMSAIFREKFPRVPILAGGVHPTKLPEFVLRESQVDYVCRGEGEDFIVDFANRLEQKQPVDDLPGLAWIDERGQFQQNPARELRTRLEDLPYPQKEPFFRYGTFHQRLYVMAGRGCPYKCTYCFNPWYQEFYRDRGSWVRYRPAEAVVEELEYFLNKYDYKEIFFYDDIFTLSRKWLREFAPLYKQRIGKPYKCLIRPDCFNEEIATLLAGSGCVYVDMGLETGDEDLRATMLGRRMSNDTIRATCQLLKKHNIRFTTLNIIGVPGETEETLRATLKLNREIRPNGVIVSTFYPFPGTKLMKIARERNLLDDAGYQKILRGEGSYKGDSLLRHPPEMAAHLRRYQSWLALAVKLPPGVGNLLLRLPAGGWSRFFSIFSLSVPRNLWIRLKELVRTILWSNFRSGGRLIVPGGKS